MFFRLAHASDIFSIQQFCNIKSIKNIYIIENKQEILGISLLEKNYITLLYAPDNIRNDFLEMIEEYLFMRYNQIYIYDNSLPSNNNPKIITKNKLSKENRAYTMYIPKKD